MASERCANAEFFLPEGSLATLANPTFSWNSSAWVELEDAAAADWIVTSVQFNLLTNAGTTTEIDVGVGAAGSEVVVATFRTITTPNNQSWCSHALPIPVDAIPSGSRVAIRCRTYLGWDVSQVKASAGFIAKPLGEGSSLTTTTKPLRCLPTGAATPTVAPAGVAWDWSAWLELAASTASALVIGGVPRISGTWTEALGEIQIGVGAAGSEVSVMWSPTQYELGGGGHYAADIRVPADVVPTGSRVAFRYRLGTTNTYAHGVDLLYYEQPL